MTHTEQEEILRRALHAVADAIEPAAGGLDRIRERLSKPRPLAVAWLMAGWTGLAQPALLRMEPVVAEVAARLWERLGTWLQVVVSSLGTAVAGLRPALTGLRPVLDRLLAAIRLLRPGPGMSRHEKLRSAIAFGAAAVIGAGGGFALSAGLPQQMISAANSFISPSQSHHTPGGGRNPGVTGGGQPLPAPGPTGHRKRNSSPTTSPSCTPKATASPHPSPTSASPSPTSASPSPTSASPSPTSASPSPTSASPTPSQSGGGIISSPAVQHASDAVVVKRVTRRGTTRPTGKASPSASPSPSC
jgi:hypothetical protein